MLNFSFMWRYLTFLFLFLSLIIIRADGEIINGQILDIEDRADLKDVFIENIYTSLAVVSDSNGKFMIAAAKGQLLVCRKLGYKTVRIRIPDGSLPSYFKIIMERGPIELPQLSIYAKSPDYKTDSVRYYELYRHELNFPKMSDLEMIQHPFSAMSKRSRQIWAFQEEFKAEQEQKYIDYVFNAKLITQLTGLAGEPLQQYMRRFRPAYAQLRNMNEYTYYTFIKRSVQQFRNVSNTPSRNSR